MFRRPTCFLSHKLEGRAIPDRGGRGVFAKERVPAGCVVAVSGLIDECSRRITLRDHGRMTEPDLDHVGSCGPRI